MSVALRELLGAGELPEAIKLASTMSDEDIIWSYLNSCYHLGVSYWITEDGYTVRQFFGDLKSSREIKTSIIP